MRHARAGVSGTQRIRVGGGVKRARVQRVPHAEAAASRAGAPPEAAAAGTPLLLLLVEFDF